MGRDGASPGNDASAGNDVVAVRDANWVQNMGEL